MTGRSVSLSHCGVKSELITPFNSRAFVVSGGFVAHHMAEFNHNFLLTSLDSV